MTNVSIEEHEQIALCLHEIRDRVHRIMYLTNPKLARRSRAYEIVGKLLRTTEQTRVLMDSLMFDHNMDAPEPSPYFTRGVHDAR